MAQNKDSEATFTACVAEEATRNAKEYLVSLMKQDLKVKFQHFCSRIQYTPDPPKAREHQINEMMSKLEIFIRLGGEIQILRKFEVSSGKVSPKIIHFYELIPSQRREVRIRLCQTLLQTQSVWYWPSQQSQTRHLFRWICPVPQGFCLEKEALLERAI